MEPDDPLGLVGRVLDEKYEIEAVAGVGGTAVVYRAMHKTWGRRIAVKVVRLLGDVSIPNRAGLFAQLSQEAGVLASLSERTSAIVQASDVGMVALEGGVEVPYIVLEWLDGACLEQVLEAEQAAGLLPRTLAEAVRFLTPVAEALSLAHRHGIAHRDVKPANLFVIGDPRAEPVTLKVVDFGIAKVVSDAYGADGGFRRTAGGATSFTPAYGAPEQFSRAYGSTGPWTDVFALALVLAEVSSGVAPLRGDDIPQLASSSISEHERPSLRRLGVSVSDAVEAVFARAVAVRPEDRYPNALELWKALCGALEMEGPASGWSSSARLLASGVSAGAPADRARGAPRAVSDTLLMPDRRERAAEAPKRPPPRDRRRVAWAGGLLGVVGVAAALATLGFAPGPRVGPSRPVAPPRAASAAPPPAAIAARSCRDGMIMVPGGKFFMGSDEAEALDFERPAHQVSLQPFCIDRTEVTVAAYVRCSESGECRRAATTNAWTDITARENATYDPLCTASDPDKTTHPINCVDWSGASAYCVARGGRLPTEAEWELAARGPDGRVYPWGDEMPSGRLLNGCGSECARWGKRKGAGLEAMYTDDDGFAGTAPVGSFPLGASRYGLEDVVGNVWEWVADWYAGYDVAEGAPATANPRGPSTGTERVIRGGAWNAAYPSWVRPTFRYKDEPTKRSHGIGFRCASTL